MSGKKPEKDDHASDDNAMVSRDLRASGQLSQVNKTRPWSGLNNRFVLMIAGIVILVVLLMMLAGGNHTAVKKTTPSVVHLDQDYGSELSANLSHIQKLNQASQVRARTLRDFTGNAGSSKAYLMRQNAPSTIYSANFSSAFAPGATSAKGGATFTGKDGYSAFGNQSTVATSVSAQRVAHPKWTVVSGEFIHAVLETAIDSDLPGQLRAVISQPVYAYVGEKPLIPAGSRLIGQYSSSTLQGQNRVFVVWNRIVLPNAVTIQLNSPGADALGRAGMGADSVNTHFFARFGEAALLSILGAGVSTVGVGGGTQYNSASQYRMNIASALQQSANSSLQNSVATKPTLNINEGATLNVFMAHDLDFYSVRSSFLHVASDDRAFVYRGDHG